MNVFILTEGGRGRGFGHIARCSALYDAFKALRIEPSFIINGDSTVKSILKGKKIKISNWLKNGNALFARFTKEDIVVIDSYLADLGLYERISELAGTSVYIDDNNRLEYPLGIVLNGAIGAERIDYSTREGVRYLLGAKFALLRKEFWSMPVKRKKVLKSILVTFGGDDQQNMSPVILRFLNKKYPKLIKNVIVGSGFKCKGILKRLKSKNVNLVYSPDAENIKRVMVGSDIAVSAGGQTLYELARAGIPTIALMVADNQRVNMDGWRKAGFIEDAGCWNSLHMVDRLSDALDKLSSLKVLIKRSNAGRALIDAKGAQRVADALLKDRYEEKK